MEQLAEKISQKIEQVGGTWGIALEDLDTGEVWLRNSDETFYAASIIKVPIMIAVFHAHEYEGLSLSETIKLRSEDIVGGCGVLQHLTPGIELSLHDLTTLMIIQSDNTATNMLIDVLGKEQIQQVMKDYGLNKSEFHHKLMTVPVEKEGSNCITAFEMTSLLKKIVTGKVVSFHACEKMIEVLMRQQITNGLPAKLPTPNPAIIGDAKSWMFAHKTGNVHQTRHEIGIFYIGKRKMIVSVLAKGIDDRILQEAFTEIGLLIYYSLNK
ncbi:serine hydrolase [Ornithinibacillus sp. L9]|uniref:Serine hydrolase n=1 Tax=Ornithinibacillus caprae TaxID=2678566 RepID=A0A6N8FLR3_9BACI|nr:serine hydrolase [Ornithinibacillus caprae]MUK89666.1 serine hydrolase [Ornithinibacillus caprae]